VGVAALAVDDAPREAAALAVLLAVFVAGVGAALDVFRADAAVARGAVVVPSAVAEALVAPAVFAFRVSLRGFPKNLTNASSLCVLQDAASCSDLLCKIHECPRLRTLWF
jgi:hypothetical protein